MFKRYRPNYSLWPEPARPRRGRPLRFAIGSFALGVVCATAYGFVFGFSGPVAGQVPAAQSAVERGPVYASVAPPVMPAPAQLDSENRSRPRAPAAKTKLPIIGSQTAAVITGNDGSGGEKLAGEALAADVAASSGNPSTAKRDESELAREIPLPKARPEQAATAGAAERAAKPRKTLVEEKREEPANAARDDSEPAREAPAQEAKPENAESAAATERSAKRKSVLQEKREETASAAREVSEPARKVAIKEARSEEAKPATAERRAKSRKTVVRESRERPAKYAAQKNRQKREEPARRAARRQNASPSITEVALRALRMVSESQGSSGLQGGGL